MEKNMREIEFRGKRIDTGEWVYGAFIPFSEEPKIQTHVDAVEIDPNTVGQYTGLKDRNGVKIFEGDIADLGPGGNGGDNGRYSPVECVDGVFRAFGYPISAYVYDPGVVEFEAAGNIHDNPELNT
jgi:hypothetical protein